MRRSPPEGSEDAGQPVEDEGVGDGGAGEKGERPPQRARRGDQDMDEQGDEEDDPPEFEGGPDVLVLFEDDLPVWSFALLQIAAERYLGERVEDHMGQREDEGPQGAQRESDPDRRHPRSVSPFSR